MWLASAVQPGDTLYCLLTSANLRPPASAELWSSGGGGIPVSLQFRGRVLQLEEKVSLHLSSPLKPVMVLPGRNH